MNPFQPAVLALVLFAQGAHLSAQAGAQDGQWRYYGGGPGSTSYSSLDQIDATNIADLEIAWRWQGANMGPVPEAKNSTTPLMVDGVLYATAGFRRNVAALDAGTGETLWMWRLDEAERGEDAPRQGSGRGVAYWTDGAGDDRVFVVTPGFRLVALDAHTGRPVAGFGERGMIDLKSTLGVDTASAIIGNSSPPVVARDVVVVGPALAMGLWQADKRNVKGSVQAFDARTGQPAWTFETIPGPGELGYDTWEGASASYSGNAGVWAPMSVDEDLGLVYLPVESATADLYGGHRLGDNLFSSSLVALDIHTGERVWHYQLVHHDIWDWDIPTAPILLDVEVDGRAVKAVAQLTKQAFTFVFDRETGEPVWPIHEVPQPASDVPGERAAATQPIPTRPAPFDRQGFSRDDIVDFTPELEARVVEALRNVRMGPLYQPVSLADAPDGTVGTIRMPGTTGGANWEGGAADPETGLLYVGSMSDPGVESLRPSADTTAMRYIANRSSPLPDFPVVKPPYGRITAIDLDTGDHVWMIANGDTPESIRNHEAFAGIELGRTGKPSRAGLLVTKTLLFAGEGWGGDPWFRAHDKATGEIIHEMELPGTQTGLPMTYLHDGRQYIVMTVGGPSQNAELVALALPY
jgi:quinoprotein glucose dehydrogenase